MTGRRRCAASLLLVGLAAAAVGCATSHPKYALKPDELRLELVRRLGAEKAARVQTPFEIDGDLAKLASKVVRGADSASLKIEALAIALGDPSQLDLHYQRDATLTARETLERRGGDCLSLTSLFIGMARSVGLNVYFIDARGVQEFTRDGDLYVDRRHIVAGYGAPPVFTMIDFDHVAAVPNVQYRILTDLQALARYFNNLGFYRLREGDNATAEEYFRDALRIDSTFAAAHNNLAVALSRTGRLEEAEREFEQALRADPSYSSAMLNLADLYRRTGRGDQAGELRRVAGALRMRDPIWRLQLGLDALRAGDAPRAIEELRAAAALDPSIMSAWLGLAQAYNAQGDPRRALKAIDRVLQFLPGDEQARQIRARILKENAPR